MPSSSCLSYLASALLVLSLSLIEHLSGSRFEIDHRFIPIHASLLGQFSTIMSANSSAALTALAISISLMLVTRNFSARLISLAGGIIALTICLATLLAHLLQIERVFGWSAYAQMSNFPVLGLYAIALTIIAETLGEISDESRRKTLILVTGTTLAGSTLTILPWASALQEQAALTHSQLRFDTESRIRLIEQELLGHVQILGMTERFLSSSDDVTELEYKRLLEKTLHRDVASGIFGIDWAPTIINAAHAEFIESARRAHTTSYDILELGSDAPILFPVLLTELADPNALALGFDHYSDPLRKEAMDRAVRLQEPMATAPVRLFRTAHLA